MPDDVDAPSHDKMIQQSEGIHVYIANSTDALTFVSSIATLHPFGLRKAFLTLVAKRKDRRVGALLAEYSSFTTRSHREQWRIFRDHYNWVRNHVPVQPERESERSALV